jgi:hypothetical protein
LAHERLSDIDYVQLWADYPKTEKTLPADLERLR